MSSSDWTQLPDSDTPYIIPKQSGLAQRPETLQVSQLKPRTPNHLSRDDRILLKKMTASTSYLSPPSCKIRMLKTIKGGYRKNNKQSFRRITRHVSNDGSKTRLRVKHYKRRTSKIGGVGPKTKPISDIDKLKYICPGSNMCIGIGKETSLINKVFGNFKNFDLAYGVVKKLGKNSVNGFIYKISYVNHGYTALGILKSTQSKDRDNLMYEYNVGLFINTICKRFTCFLETYSIFEYKSLPNYREFLLNSSISSKKLKSHLKKINLDYSLGCKDANLISILIQYVEGITLGDLIMLNINDIKFINYEVLCILFQVYYSLSKLRNNFTHYDLHDNNVIVYEPVKGAVIRYKYYTDAGYVTFQSRYVAKIIDYGRCYFNNGLPGGSSDDVFRLICGNPACDDPEYGNHCASSLGIRLDLTKSNINPSKRNMSADLRLIYIVLNELNDTNGYRLNEDFHTMRNSLVFDRLNYFGRWSTAEITSEGLPSSGKINNVTDASLSLGNYITKNAHSYENPNAFVWKTIDIDGCNDIVSS